MTRLFKQFDIREEVSLDGMWDIVFPEEGENTISAFDTDDKPTRRLCVPSDALT